MWSILESVPHELETNVYSSWMYLLMFFIRFEKFWGMSSSDILPSPCSLRSRSGTLIMPTLACLMTCHGSLRHCSFFFVLSVPESRKSQLTYFEAVDIFLLPAQLCCWAPAREVFILVSVLLSSRISFGSFLYFLLFYPDILWGEIILILSFHVLEKLNFFIFKKLLCAYFEIADLKSFYIHCLEFLSQFLLAAFSPVHGPYFLVFLVAWKPGI